MRALLFISLIGLFLSGCKKEPGEGGKSEIRGYVYRQDVAGNGSPIGDPYPYPEARVYIIYGDHDFYDDDIRTGPDGLFVFSWLRKGSYRVYTFSECDPNDPDCVSEVVPVYATADVDGKDEVKNVGTLTSINF